ncbi:KpsF/GutQ family sugar-phosphate isomerase [Xanthobacter wiegelii]|uniref:KpsF/GutQ family sugar-phosphate isomerase n=1 Tax=Xanthobacter wiegelii TaxID=3119913 RepID=UPI00372C1C55
MVEAPVGILRQDNGHLSIDLARASIETEKQGLEALGAAFEGPLGTSFTAFLERVRSCRGRVIVTGMGKSGHISRKIAATLASTGTQAFFVHPAEASHGDLGMIAADDIVLALSWSGETPELRAVIDYTRRFGIFLAAITSQQTSALARAADLALILPRVRESCPHNLAPTTSTLLQLALGDAIAVTLLQMRSFTAIDFRNFHPGGKLGASLLFVRDIMHCGPALPTARYGTRMSDALLEMTGKGFGCIGVVSSDGVLRGIITDGDLRRHMSDNLLAHNVETIMTPSPRTITPEQLASEALAILNKINITTLFVVGADGAPVGIVHVHDLLRLGIV